MATVSAVSDSSNAPPSSALVLPPTNTTQFALGQPAIDAAQDTLATTGLPNTSAASSSTASVGLASTDTPVLLGASANAATSTDTETSPSPLASVSNQPLAVVLDALASAGIDNGINDVLLAPSVGVVGESAGTFSNFMEELFTTLAAQPAAAPATNATQQTAAAPAQDATAGQHAAAAAPTTAAQSNAAAPAAANSGASAFAVNAPSTAANSAFESDLQNLAQAVSAGTNATGATANTALQQSFAQFVAGVGGTTSSSSLGGFLQALASNLHTAPSRLGNIVNYQA